MSTKTKTPKAPREQCAKPLSMETTMKLTNRLRGHLELIANIAPRSFLEVFGVPDLNNELAKRLLSAHREETIEHGEHELEQTSFEFKPIIEADFADLEHRLLAQLGVSEEVLQSLRISRKDVESLRKL